MLLRECAQSRGSVIAKSGDFSVEPDLGPSDVTTLLRAWSDRDLRARDQLMPVVYGELHRRAAAQLRKERRDHTLQPTALTRLAAFDPRKSQIARAWLFAAMKGAVDREQRASRRPQRAPSARFRFVESLYECAQSS